MPCATLPLEKLDYWASKFEAGDINDAMHTLVGELLEVRKNMPVEQWNEFATFHCRDHKLLEILHQDPFSRRCFEKPRGYPGDAIMLDYLYAMEDGTDKLIDSSISADGKEIYHYMANDPAAKAVRFRRKHTAGLIDEIASRTDSPTMLSVACGHLREAEMSCAIKENRIGRFDALDLDQDSLREVNERFSQFGVNTIHAPVKRILQGDIELGGYDFVYTLGLYDYLQVSVARKLTSCFFDLLNPGGELLIANFMPGIFMTGYMEVFLDWWLIYRGESQMRNLADGLDETLVDDVSIFVEENKNIIFMKIRRK